MRTAELWCNGLLVARLRDVSSSEGTFYGRVQAIDPGSVAQGNEVEAFIRFSREWNRRVEEHPEMAPNPAEFDRFGAVMGQGRWELRVGEHAHPIVDAPVFYGVDEVSWICNGDVPGERRD